MLTDSDIERLADAVVSRLAGQLGLASAQSVKPSQSFADRLISLAGDPSTRNLSIELAKAHSRASRKGGTRHA